MSISISEITAPLRPLIHPGEIRPRQSSRLWQRDALDYTRIETELEANTLADLQIGERYNTPDRVMHRHSVVNVVSPYVSSGIHVMTINRGRAYGPSPHWLPDDVGSALVDAWGRIIAFMEAQGANRVSIGWNWSPIGFGFPEENLGGGQSLPTRFHLMLAGEPMHLREEQGKRVEWDRLTPSQQRLFSGGDYARPLAGAIKDRVLASLADPYFRAIFENASTYEMGLRSAIDCSISDLVGRPGFFNRLLTPLSREAEGIFRDLTTALTHLPYDEILQLLQQTEYGPVPVELLRSTPMIRDVKSARQAMEAASLPSSLIDVLYEPVRQRCSLPERTWELPLTSDEREELNGVWRKGFAYSAVLMSTGSASCELRIAPYVYAGGCGMMEAAHVLLKRTTEPISNDLALEMSATLWNLARHL